MILTEKRPEKAGFGLPGHTERLVTGQSRYFRRKVLMDIQSNIQSLRREFVKSYEKLNTISSGLMITAKTLTKERMFDIMFVSLH